jgi:hypothetical protein
MEKLPHDILIRIAYYLDKYDANNLRMVSKVMLEEAAAIQKIHVFNKPVFRENVEGYCCIVTPSCTIRSIDCHETLGWKIDKSPRRKENKYIIYLYDDYGGFPYFVSDRADWLSIIASYKAYKEGVRFQRKFLEEKEQRRKEEAKNIFVEAKNIFVLKGSAAPTNPWKKFVSKV